MIIKPSITFQYYLQCEYLEVSTDYILGLSDIKEIKTFIDEDITKKL